MTTTRRRAHTRTVNGRTVRVRESRPVTYTAGDGATVTRSKWTKRRVGSTLVTYGAPLAIGGTVMGGSLPAGVQVPMIVVGALMCLLSLILRAAR